jgi:hypothetical protein
VMRRYRIDAALSGGAVQPVDRQQVADDLQFLKSRGLLPGRRL